MSEEYIKKEEALKILEEHKYSREFCSEHGIDFSINMEMVRILLNRLQPLSIPNKPEGEEVEAWEDYLIRRGLAYDWISTQIEKIRAEIVQFREALVEKAPSLKDLINAQRTVDICLGIIDKELGGKDK